MKGLLIAMGFAVLSGAANAEGVADLSWLTGCWVQADGDRTVEEYWTKPSGGVLMGAGKTLRAGKLRNYEHMRIEPIAGVLTFTAIPSGQAEASFPAKSQAEGEVIFENLAHDFPQRVIYRKAHNGLSARIEGVVNGQSRSVDFTYKRCGAD
ncbi:DUF6265 family protein [Asticcacaulis endophyticus]|uniref:DUF6265 domain-containing protein n=1 Tax=Asticcacaulis endophyticus TaxID=1395890 RepID=A0A918QA96_9CAUL|nr:DUF6265 family protein [Asticcacaulis endophyticus]GGZ36856.1 hypothetical protein GCM10011273_23990 [Asticcacaulis endophyticus]